MTISMAALLLHACLLGGLDWAWPARAAVRAHAPAMQVRSVAANLAPTEAVLDEAPIEPAPAEAALQTAPSKPVRPALHRVARAVRAMGPRPEAAPRVSDIQARVALIDPEPQTETMAIPVLASTVAAVAEASIDAGGDELVPVYRTRLPPAMTLRYQMSRGILHGTGELQWRPAADHYELRLEGRVAGLAILTQTSAGGFDAAGLAPLRFTDQRMRRAAVAANFQRDADKITFSGPSAELPLLPGEQDRLSWMVQLAAIAAAEPGLLVP